MRDGAGGRGLKLPKGHGGFEGLCTVPLVTLTHFQPHGSPLVLEQRRRVSRHDSKAGIPAQLLIHMLSVPGQVTFLLDFVCAFAWMGGRWMGCPSKSKMNDSLFFL